MKIITSVESFTAALKSSIKPSSKTSIPVLTHARLNGSSVTVTDLDLTSIVEFDAIGDGDFLVPYRQTLKVLDKETGPLTITYDPPREVITPGEDGAEDKTEMVGGQWVTFAVNDCEFNLETLPVTHFPVSPDPIAPSLAIDSAPFIVLLNRTRFAISKEETRYTLNAALLKATGGTLRMVTTDGHRLSHATTFADGEINTLIATDALDWLKSKAAGLIEIGADDNYQMFRMDGRTLFSRKITGQFPNYEAVMPRDYAITADLPSSGKLAGLITRVAKCADERSGAVKFAFNGALELEAKADGAGRAYALCECLTQGLPEGHDSLALGLSAPYILQYLKALGEAPVSVKLRDNQSSALLTAENWDYVVMPMRL